MNTFFQIVKMLPAVISAVKAVEEALPLRGQGKAKLDAVLGIIADTNESVESLLPPLTSVIGRVVALFNGTGAFAKA